MKAELLVLFFIAGLSVVSAQLICRIPDSFEAHVFEHDSRRTFNRYERYYYDENNGRIATFEETETANGRNAYDDIYLYRQGVQYHTNSDTKVCRKINITGEAFPRFELPFNAEFLAPLYIGAESYGVGLRMNLFAIEKTPGERTVLGVAPSGCIPIRRYHMFRETGYFFREDFYDVRLGLDPNHFVPPTQCE